MLPKALPDLSASRGLSEVDDYRHWKPEAQQRALELLQQRERSPWRPFYCKDRRCDGHGHFDYDQVECPEPCHLWVQRKGAWLCSACKVTGTPRDNWTWEHARVDQRPPRWMDDWIVLFLMSGRGAGKAVSYDTLMPTPLTSTLLGETGWTTMKEVDVGTVLFDELGNPTTVLAVYDVLPGKAYRVTFSDGTFIDACSEHQWVTLDCLDRKRLNRQRAPLPLDWADRAPVTTDQLAASVHYGARGDRNHCIPLAQPLTLPPQPLLVDPWVLGYWLGNGSVGSGSVTTHPDDETYIRTQMLSAGYACGLDYARNLDKAPTFTPRGLMVNLRTLGVLSNKHIPARYLRGSEDQRTALIAGMLDSDGYDNPNKGCIEFCTTTEALATGFMELARTLGQKPVCKEGRSSLHGVDKGPKWRVTFRPTESLFRSPRKSATWIPLAGQGLRSRHRMVVSVEPVEPEPMRCVMVDSPNSMYLVGDAMIPTHNTRAGSEITQRATKVTSSIGLIAPTGPDLRNIMVEGRAGVLATSPPGQMPEWEPSKKKLTWPNGCVGQGFSSEEPDRLRGPEHGFVWTDEPAHYPMVKQVWDMMLLGLRVKSHDGSNAKVIATSTPKSTPWIKETVKEDTTVVHRASTYANIQNLDPTFKKTILSRFEGTRTGRQELHGEILEDVEGALWQWAMMRYCPEDEMPDLVRVIVGVDPAGTANKKSDETGIVTVGISAAKNLYVIGDATGKYSPGVWARTANAEYETRSADAIAAEKNYGGDMVKFTLENSGYKGARIIEVQSRRGKAIRAEPIVALYEKKRVFHVGERGTFLDLEEELTGWVPGEGDSPNRLDALVHAATELAKDIMPAEIANPNDLRRTGALGRPSPFGLYAPQPNSGLYLPV